MNKSPNFPLRGHAVALTFSIYSTVIFTLHHLQ